MILRYVYILAAYSKLLYNLRYASRSGYDSLLIRKIVNNIKGAGAIAIKLSQWSIPKLELMHSNGDISWLKASEELYDNCNIHSEEYTKSLYKETFGKEFEEDYQIKEILGSGSIGQVYKILNKKTGKNEVLKVKHPNIEEELWLFRVILKLINMIYGDYLIKLYPFDIKSFLEDFEKQLDFVNEANNILYYDNKYRDNEYIIIPDIRLVSNSILIMSYEESNKIDNKILSDYNKYKVINILFLFIRNNEIILNYNHGDLHKGNWGVRGDKIVIYDFGFCYSADPVEYEIVKLLPQTFEAENVRTLEENQKNLMKITEELIKNDIDSVIREKVKDLILLKFKNCETFSAARSDGEGSPENMVNIVIEFCRENGYIIKSKLLNYFILFIQCAKFYDMCDAISVGRTSETLFKKRYVDIIVFCKTNKIFTEYAKYIVEELNKHELNKATVFDTIKYDTDIQDELLSLIKKDK